MNLYYTLRLPPRQNARVLVNLFKRLPEVEEAWIVPSYVLTAPSFQDSADVPPGDAYQQYLDPAPVGVDAHFAWTQPGGNGAGVNVFDIEHGFNPDHVDLPDVQIGLGFLPDNLGGASEHGTATLGVIAAKNDGSGITGIAHGSSMHFYSTQHMTTGYPYIEGVDNEPDSYPDGYAMIAYSLDDSDPVAHDDVLNGNPSAPWTDGYDDAGLTIRIFPQNEANPGPVTLKARVYLRVDDDIFVGGEVLQWTYTLAP